MENKKQELSSFQDSIKFNKKPSMCELIDIVNEKYYMYNKPLYYNSDHNRLESRCPENIDFQYDELNMILYISL